MPTIHDALLNQQVHRRPGQAKHDPGPITTRRGYAKARAPAGVNNSTQWLRVPAFAGIKNENEANALWAYIASFDKDGKTK